MQLDKKKHISTDKSAPDNNTSQNTPNNSEKGNVAAARQQADNDIEGDADLSIHSSNDDLDEEETLRLGKDENPIT